MIDLNETLSRLTSAVELRGEDYVYNEHYSICRYFINDKPACIVGVAFADVLAESGITDMCSTPVSRLGLPLTTDALSALIDAQNWQDQGDSWGAALQQAWNTITD